MNKNVWIKSGKKHERFGKDFESEAEFAFAEAEEITERVSELEEKIAQSAHFSYLYACKLNERFLLGEEAISKQSHYSILYAQEIVKGRFEIGEEAILKDEKSSYKYYFLIKEWSEIPEAFIVAYRNYMNKLHFEVAKIKGNI